MIKNLPAGQETWDQSLGWKGTLGEENDSPLQYSCLENSMDTEAWQTIESMGLQRAGHD